MASLVLFLAIFLTAGAFQKAGPVGDFLFQKLSLFLGIGYYLIPLAFLLIAIAIYIDIKKKFSKIRIFGIFLFLISTLGFIDLISEQGGWLGSILSKTENFLGPYMALTLSLILTAISLTIIFDSVPKFKKREKENFAEKKGGLSEKERKNLQSNLDLNEKTEKKKLFNLKNESQNNKIDNEKIEQTEEKKVFKISTFEKKKLESDGEKMSERVQESYNL